MNQTPESELAAAGPFPEAKVQRAGNLADLLDRGPGLFWLLTAVALLIAIGLWFANLHAAGTRITVRFQQGHGIQPGDPVRHRGINVGTVRQVLLDKDLTHVRLVLQLEKHAGRLARAGSRFWIERPEVSMLGVHGLDTVLSGQFVAVLPGPEKAERTDLYDGLETRPQWLEQQPGSLEIVLEDRDRGGLESGSPILYRGIPIGQILSIGLSADATLVEARGVIQPAYRQLVRTGSRFWNSGGFKASLGVGGLQLHAGTLSTIATGGIALATPDPAGPLATSGTRFRLQEEPDAWRAWSPAVPIGVPLLSNGSVLPQPVRATLVWQESLLGFSRNKQRSGWLLPLAGRRLLGPHDLLTPPASAIDHRATLQFEGHAIALRKAATSDPAGLSEDLALLEIADSKIKLRAVWPLQKIRRLDRPEDCLIVTGSRDAIRPLPADRLVHTASQPQSTGDWTLVPSFALDPEAHGACIVAVRDGAVVGILVVENGQPRIAFPPESVVRKK